MGNWYIFSLYVYQVVSIIEANNEKTVVNKGDTVLIPACIDEIGLTCLMIR